MKPIDNEYTSLHSDGLFYDAVNLTMRLFKGENGVEGPRHIFERDAAEVHDDGSITFCFFAPEAREVSVGGFGGSFSSIPVPMTKDEAGYWTVRIDTLPAGFHYVNFFVDGVAVTNPLGRVAYGGHKTANIVEIPEKDDFYMLKDVPHGTVHMEHFSSSVTGKIRNCWV